MKVQREKFEEASALLDKDSQQAKTGLRLRARHRQFPVWVFLILGDFLAASIALAVAKYIFPQNSWIFSGNFSEGLIYCAALLAIFGSFGLYNFNSLSGGDNEYARVLGATNFLVLIGLVWQVVKSVHNLPVTEIVGIWAILLSCLLLMRFMLRRVWFLIRSTAMWHERTVILGATGEGMAMARQWTNLKSSGLEVVGFLDDSLPAGHTVEGNLKVIGSSDELSRIIKDQQIDSLMVADIELLRKRLIADDHIIETLNNVEVQISTGVSEFLNTSVRVRELGFLPIIVLQKHRIMGLHFFAKCVLDYLAATILTILLLPLFVLVSVLIRLESKGPILYSRKCVGIGAKDFGMLKFRSMFIDGASRLTPELEAELHLNHKIKDDPRITRVGAFLRKFSIDELPQLLNVLRGEMSLVGPRPVIAEELEKYGTRRHTRSVVKPGMTGLWQVSGRSDLSYDDRVMLDVYYISNYTIWIDIQIILQTIPAVLFNRGAY